MSEKSTIFDVAEYFLAKLNRTPGSIITPLKLQKLAYYSQVWSLVLNNELLFKEDMEAWSHGPANPNLYNKYKIYGANNIDSINRIDFSVFNKNQIKVMDMVLESYGKYYEEYLERLTNQEEPWKKARGNCYAGQYCNTIIDLRLVKEYYSKIYSESGD